MYPLPDPRHLALHATVAKVVHAAGINMHLKDIVKKYDSICQLEDESGLEYLDGCFVLRRRQANQQPHQALLLKTVALLLSISVLIFRCVSAWQQYRMFFELGPQKLPLP